MRERRSGLRKCTSRARASRHNRAYASATGLWAGKLSGFAELDALDHDVLDRTVAPARRLRLDRVDRVHAVRHAAEHGVLAVEPRRGVGRDDEELAAVGVRPRVRHRQRAAHHLLVVDLVLERVAGAAGPRALGAAALDHEVADHAVEDQPVVEAVAGELAEVADRLRRVVVEQLQADRPVVRVHCRLAHLPVTSSSSSVPLTRFPRTFFTTSSARRNGTSAKLKRSSTRTPVTSSPSRCEWSTIAPITSAGSRPSARPAPIISFVRAPSRLPAWGFVWRGRRGWRRSRSPSPSPAGAAGG